MSCIANAAAARRRPGFLRALTFATTLTLPCTAALAAPSISGSPATSVTAAHYYAFQPSATDPGKKLSFSIVNKPSWALFDASSGRLYGTPMPQSNVGTFSNIVISASDGSARASLAPFSIKVLPLPDTPPTLAGSPAPSVTTGHAYTFLPKSGDPNGLRLVFAIANKPSWARFDSTTGLLSGTAGAVGTYSNIVITAYDGWSKAALPAFNIVVTQAAATTVSPPVAASTGSATLAWTPPTETASGTVLTNLAGYRVFYGTTPEAQETLTLPNAGLTRYVMTGLAKTTWYFAIAAYDTNGQESKPTEVLSLAVD
jgi:Putative Ig domain